MLSYLRKKMKTIMIIVAVLFAATMFYGLGYTGIKNIGTGVKKNSIATINGKEVDTKRLQQTVNQMFSKNKGRLKPDQAMMYQTMALDQLIDFTLMLNESKKRYRVSRGELDQTIDQIIQANKIPSKTALIGALKNMGQSFDEFKKTIKDEILVSKMVNKIKGEVTITPDDLREVKARHILIIPRGSDEKSEFEARAKAEELLKRIKNGESFSNLAKQYSDDNGSAKQGGDLGYFTAGRMVPEFERTAFLLKPGEVSNVIRTSFGYHIIKVDDTRLRSVKDKSKDINEQVLAEKQEQTFGKWIYELRQKAKIEVNDPVIRAYSMLMAGKVNDAISAFNQASMDNPYNPYIHLFLGDAYIMAGSRDLAEMEYKKVVEFSGADPGLIISVADAYSKMKKRDLALEQYRRASLIAGDNKEIHIELKDIFKKLGASVDAAKEQSDINRIEKKEKFEKEIQDKLK